jgi:Large ribosomal RNA subunit accumulation protein YceD
LSRLAAASPVSFEANVARLPHKGMPVIIDADAAQRERLAADHGLLSVESWRAELLVEPWKRNGVKVSGHVDADITQQCVVTLEPLAARISEEVSGLYFPEDSKIGRLGFHAAGEVHLDAEGPDSPETFTGETIDVGALAEEFFGLAIDPYPRSEGASVAAAGAPDDAGDHGPLYEKLDSLRRKL